MTRPARDGKRQRRSQLRLRLPAECRLSCGANPGEAARAADARRGSMGIAQRYPCAGAEVSAVHRRVSRDRRRLERVAYHSHATANGAGVAVLERADAAGRAHVDSIHPSDPHRAQSRKLVGRLQRNDQHSRVCAPHLGLTAQISLHGLSGRYIVRLGRRPSPSLPLIVFRVKGPSPDC